MTAWPENPELCRSCLPPDGPAALDDESVFPDSWRRLEDLHEGQVGAWAASLRRCLRCGSVWHVSYHPKDGCWHDAFRLPAEIEPLLRDDRELAVTWPLVGRPRWEGGGRIADAVLAELVSRYLQEAHYSAEEAVRRSVAALEEGGLDVVGACRWLEVLWLVVDGWNLHHQRHLRDHGYAVPLARLEGPAPLLGLLAREDLLAGSEAERRQQRRRLHATFRRFVEGAFRSANRRGVDRLEVPPETRRRLLALAGIEDLSPSEDGVA